MTHMQITFLASLSHACVTCERGIIGQGVRLGRSAQGILFRGHPHEEKVEVQVQGDEVKKWERQR